MIKKITKKYFEQFILLRLESLKTEPNSFLSTFDEEKKYSKQQWQNKFNQGVWFGYFKDGNMIAMVNFLIGNKVKIMHTSEISGLYVKKEYRGQGLAKQLVEFILQYAKKKKISQIYLGCNANNINAINLYKKFGFKVFATRPKYVRINNIFFDDFLMVKIVD